MKKIQTANGSKKTQKIEGPVESELKRLNKNIEAQLRLWSFWPVLLRAIINALGYMIGLAILVTLAAFAVVRYSSLPLVGRIIENLNAVIKR